MPLKDDIAKHHLQDALDDIEADGRHWPGAMSRPGAGILCGLVQEAGHKVHVHELPPEWEHVIALRDTPHSQLLQIASDRARLRASGTAEELMPK